jgi:hypothetical protein
MERIRSWVLDNVVAALSITGVAMYVSLRWPYSIYYGTLHTSPGDVGIGYTQVLAESALGVLLIAASAAALSMCLAFIIGYAVLVRRVVSAQLRTRPTPTPAGGANVYALSDAQLANLDDDYCAALSDREVDELVLPAMARYAKERVPGLGDVFMDVAGPRIRTAILVRRDWAKAGKEGPKPRSQLGPAAAARMIARLVYRAVRRWVGFSFACWLAALVLVGVPLYAHVQANNVKSRCATRGLHLALFDFRAQPATLLGGGVEELIGDRLIYLGQGGDTYVLFNCDKDETFIIPISGHTVAIDS